LLVLMKEAAPHFSGAAIVVSINGKGLELRFAGEFE
jgi:hypothetical protein